MRLVCRGGQIGDGMTAGATPQDEKARERLVGILLICCAFLCFSLLDATAKWLNHAIPSVQTTWARYMSNVVLVFFFLNPITRPGVSRTTRPGLQVVRSLLLFTSTAANFFALQYLQLAQTISIAFATPLLVALLAGPMLGEKVGAHRLGAIVVGFMGVLVVTRPGLGMHWAVALCMLNVVTYALYNIATRRLAAYDSPQTTLFYSGLAGVVILTPLLPWFWREPPDAWVWFGMAMTGVFGGFGHYLLILAYQRAPAAVLSPFIYTQLLWMTGLGYLLFGDVPDRFTFIGSLIVVASGLYLLLHERRR